MKDKTPTKIISRALRIVAGDIQSDDGVASAACIQAANRLDEYGNFENQLQKIIENINDFLEELEPRKF